MNSNNTMSNVSRALRYMEAAFRFPPAKRVDGTLGCHTGDEGTKSAHSEIKKDERNSLNVKPESSIQDSAGALLEAIVDAFGTVDTGQADALKKARAASGED